MCGRRSGGGVSPGQRRVIGGAVTPPPSTEGTGAVKQEMETFRRARRPGERGVGDVVWSGVAAVEVRGQGLTAGMADIFYPGDTQKRSARDSCRYLYFDIISYGIRRLLGLVLAQTL